jgi:hypothetical protein
MLKSQKQKRGLGLFFYYFLKNTKIVVDILEYFMYNISIVNNKKNGGQ